MTTEERFRTEALFDHRPNGRETDERYTPRWLFDALTIRFDLDVASPVGGAPWVPADRYYTVADDGLAQPWHGRVWMNPPYSTAAPWVDRFIEHRDGICLVPINRGVYIDRLWAAADGITKISETGDGIWFTRPDDGTARVGRDRAIRLQWPFLLAAFGDECVEAIARVGPIRRVAA